MTFNRKISKEGSAEAALQQLLESHDIEHLQLAALNVFGTSDQAEHESESSFQHVTVEDSIQQFFGSSKFREFAETTQDTYRCEVKLFCDFLYRKFGTLDLSLTEVIYPTSILLDYVEGPGLSNNTKVKKAAFLRTFIKTIVNEFYLLNKESFDGTLKVDWDRDGLPRFYNIEQLKELLQLSKETAFGLRNFTIISVFLGTALRISELVGIQIKDIDLESEVIYVRRKRKKHKLVPAFIQHDALKVLMGYINFVYGHLEEDWKEFKTNHGELYVFSSTSGKTALTERAVRGMVKNLAKSAKSFSDDERINLSVHNFRHSYAVYGIRSGINLYAMMRLMGHSTVSSLEPYAKQTGDQLKEDMEKNPISQLI